MTRTPIRPFQFGYFESLGSALMRLCYRSMLDRAGFRASE